VKLIASLGLAGLVLGTACTASAAARPTLGVLDREPLVVRGDGFRPGETVHVTALTGLGPRFARVTARAGRFRVEFRLPDTGCAAARAVVARGSAGSTARTTFAGRAGVCVPPPRD
jgi:hypothetical protein